jgi:hypothetical protein
VLPAGIYQVEIDEELLEGLSFPAYRRKSTVIHLHAEAGHPGRTRSLEIDPKELDAALERDQRATTARVSRPHVKESPGKATDTLRKEKKIDSQASGRDFGIARSERLGNAHAASGG